MFGESSALQANHDVRAPIFTRAANPRAGFRSGLPGRRAQDAQAMQTNARLRAPIFDLRATNRQAPREHQPVDITRAAKRYNVASGSKLSVQDASASEAPASAAPSAAFSLPAGLSVLVPAGPASVGSLQRLSVNDAYISAEALDASYAHRGSFFDLQI